MSASFLGPKPRPDCYRNSMDADSEEILRRLRNVSLELQMVAHLTSRGEVCGSSICCTQVPGYQEMLSSAEVYFGAGTVEGNATVAEHTAVLEDAAEHTAVLEDAAADHLDRLKIWEAMGLSKPAHGDLRGFYIGKGAFVTPLTPEGTRWGITYMYDRGTHIARTCAFTRTSLMYKQKSFATNVEGRAVVEARASEEAARRLRQVGERFAVPPAWQSSCWDSPGCPW